MFISLIQRTRTIKIQRIRTEKIVVLIDPTAVARVPACYHGDHTRALVLRFAVRRTRPRILHGLPWEGHIVADFKGRRAVANYNIEKRKY